MTYNNDDYDIDLAQRLLEGRCSAACDVRWNAPPNDHWVGCKIRIEHMNGVAERMEKMEALRKAMADSNSFFKHGARD